MEMKTLEVIEVPILLFVGQLVPYAYTLLLLSPRFPANLPTSNLDPEPHVSPE